MQRIYPDQQGKPVSDVRGLANGLTISGEPLLREAFPSIPATDFRVYEDFRYGFSVREDSAGGDPVACHPWRLAVLDGDNDNAHSLSLKDNATDAQLYIVTNNKDNDENAIQYSYEPLTGGKKFGAEVKLKVSDISASALFFGFHNFKAAGTIAQTAVLGGVASGFHVPDGATGVILKASSDNGTLTQTDLDGTTGGTMTDDTFVTLSLFNNGDTTKFYVDGTLAATHTFAQTNVGTLTASPTIALATSGAAATNMTVAYMGFWVEG